MSGASCRFDDADRAIDAGDLISVQNLVRRRVAAGSPVRNLERAVQNLKRRGEIWNIFYFSFPDIGNSGCAVRKFRFIIEDRGMKKGGGRIEDRGWRAQSSRQTED